MPEQLVDLIMRSPEMSSAVAPRHNYAQRCVASKIELYRQRRGGAREGYLNACGSVHGDVLKI